MADNDDITKYGIITINGVGYIKVDSHIRRLNEYLSDIIEGIDKLDKVYEGHLVFREDVIKLIESFKSENEE